MKVYTYVFASAPSVRNQDEHVNKWITELIQQGNIILDVDFKIIGTTSSMVIIKYKSGT